MSTIDFNLSDRFDATSGTVALSGIQAVVRIPVDQVRRDARTGLQTAGLICGYRGSPVGGMDQIVDQNAAVLQQHEVRFISGLNEDLAATAVWGSQMASLEDGRRFDGVVGMWYGKGPGVDRSGDAFRHANTSGVHPNGGVLAIAGDDPECKSSTIPSASEWALADQAMPTLFPGSVQDVLDFGVLGYALSRFCGSWVGFKLNTNVADGYATVDVDLDRLSVAQTSFLVDGKPWQAKQTPAMIAPYSVQQEEEMYGARLDAARVFMAAQNLDVTVGASDGAKVGILAAGPLYGEVRTALARLGLPGEADLAAAGIRVYKPAMIWPLEPVALRRFARDVGEIMVVEEKRAFIETQVRDLLYGTVNAPVVIGKRDSQGQLLIPNRGALLAGDLTGPLRSRLTPLLGNQLTPERTRIAVTATVASEVPGRTAYYCSGCPHNTSTVVPEGSVAGAGIGCHTMAMYMDRDTYGVTHMGGEGIQWVGMAPFLNEKHRFQNLGDGTLAHSGYLAIRQAISAGTTITYKILYNGTVAMTGGQDAAGEMPVPELTRALEAEGVRQIVVVTDDVDKYDRNARFAPNSRVEHRDQLDAVQRELRDVPGVTVLVYDQGCAAELRRGRKRGTLETPATRVLIDERICEGCGDCGAVSNCASVHPVQTPFGRKTQIHQASCNYDLTCLKGNCPAFVTVEVDPDHKPTRAALAGVPEGPVPPDPTIPESGSPVLIGIGGTGVVTLSQILSTAALIDGRQVSSLDQTGLAQKGGPVVSNLRISTNEIIGSNYVADGDADVLLVFDLLGGATTKNLSRANPEHTVAVVSTGLVPTGEMVSGRGAELFPELEVFRNRIDAATQAHRNVWLDADGIARRVFGSQPAANVLIVGVAYQLGLIPVSGAAIQQAITLNGVAVDTNLEAFRLGRRIAHDPQLALVLQEQSQRTTSAPALTGAAADLAATVSSDHELAEVLAWRIPELIAYQDKKYAKAYVEFVQRVRAVELRLGVSSQLSCTVARHLYKLMAYKDEYEVARLALSSGLSADARARFGANAKMSYRLHPPTLKALGMEGKVAIPETAGRAMFKSLVKGKRLRGTRLDPFARDHIRRTERELIVEYRALVETLVGSLSAATAEQAVEIADLAGHIRGYDDVKLANVAKYREDVQRAMVRWPGSTGASQ